MAVKPAKIIGMNIRLLSLIFSLIFVSGFLNGQVVTQRTVDGLNAQGIVQNTITRSPIEYQYFFDSIVVRKNDGNENMSVNKVGNYLFEYEANQLTAEANQLSSQDRYIVVTGTDQSVKFFNGSIIIRFNELPNFESFAAENDLIFMRSLPQIGIGIYKARDIRTTQSDIQRLSKNQNVKGVELDLVDPYVVPN
tara:strand:+ start:15 stop:596 length:582 start_codon:yes stop_codon:yes gene_type:complete